MPETAEIYEWLTPREFLMLIGEMRDLKPDITSEKIEQVLSHFRLLEDADTRMTAFSKGMKQKVMISSALLHNPDVIFLDEPLSGLDIPAMTSIKNLIRGLASSGKTVFYCSHILDIVERICDRIMILSKGQIAAKFSMNALKKKKNLSLEIVFRKITGMEVESETELLNTLVEK